jgi:hypothetical protein
MDYLQIIGSLNKIGVVFFVLTLIALIYEVRAFRRESHTKSAQIKIPEFDPNQTAPSIATAPLPVASSQGAPPITTLPKRPSLLPIIITIIVLVGLGIILLVGFFAFRQPQKVTVTPSPAASALVKSQGIKMYDLNWQPLTRDDVRGLTPGTQIVIGIATVQSVAVDRARIRVNQTQWTAADETTQFNPDEHVYYISYTLPEGFENLVIEAQLHSTTEGWPPDFVYEKN